MTCVGNNNVLVTLKCITKAGSFMTCDGNITLDCITKAGSFMTCDGNNYISLRESDRHHKCRRSSDTS